MLHSLETEISAPSRAGEHPLSWVDRGVYLLCLFAAIAAICLDWGVEYSK